jgi:tRNA A-37 threonylcarbamoyl transferase component Bud32
VSIEGFVLKRYNLKGAWRFLKDLFRISRARRTFEIACRLVKLGLPVAEPVGFADAKTFGLPTVSYYISKGIQGGQSLAEFLSSGTPLPSAYTKAVARLLAEMHTFGVSNRDLKVVNLVFNEKKQPMLVDLDGIRFYSEIPEKKAAKNILRLFRSANQIVKVSPLQKLVFVRAYCRHRNLSRMPKI